MRAGVSAILCAEAGHYPLSFGGRFITEKVAEVFDKALDQQTRSVNLKPL